MEQELKSSAAAHSVVVIDDCEIIRFGMERLVAACPELRLVGSAWSLAEGLRLVRTLRPELVISELATGDSSGLDTVRALVAAQGPRLTLIVSGHDEAYYAEQAILLGARGYVTKERAAAIIVPAALTVLGGAIWASPEVHASLLNRIIRRSPPRGEAAPRAPSLSERELKVVELLKSGMSTKQIAGVLGLSARTVDVHRAGIKRKLGLRTGAELVAFASTRF